MKIVAIGGGEIDGYDKEKQTSSIDRNLIRLSGKSRPKMLFIPTASDDSKIYCINFLDHFGRKLGCDIDFLKLYSNPSLKSIENKIMNADIIYVGGGNTYKMMKKWRKLGIEKLLLSAGEKGAVLSGLSAGAICWFKYGHSDSWTFNNPQAPSIRVSGIGFIEMLLCPHYSNEKNRKPSLMKMMKRTSCPAIALDDRCAVEIVDDQYRTISCNEYARAYKIYWKNGRFHEEELEQLKRYRPIEELIKK